MSVARGPAPETRRRVLDPARLIDGRGLSDRAPYPSVASRSVENQHVQSCSTLRIAVPRCDDPPAVTVERAMTARPRHGTPHVGDAVRILHLSGPEDGVVVAVEEAGRRIRVAAVADGEAVFTLRQASGLYVDDRQVRLAFGDEDG